MTDGYMKWRDIRATYPDQWVLLDRVRTDRYQQLLGGHVIDHAADRDELERRFPEHTGRGIMAFEHTSDVPVWRVGPTRWETAGTVAAWTVGMTVLVAIGWFAAILFRPAPPDAVTRFDRIHAELDEHVAVVRSGAIAAETDANGITRYPLPDGVRRAGVAVCIERDRALWYLLPSHPLDGGSEYYVTPLTPGDPVTALPARWSGKTFHFQTLRGNWVYWFKG